MSSSDFWDSRYSEKGYAYGTEPNDFLKETWLKIQLPNKPSVLLLADGEGRNSVFVAQQGAQATAVDISAVGMAKTQKLAREKGVAESVTTVVADLADYDLGHQQWDVIVSIYNHMPPPLRQKVLEAVPRALKAGGYFVLEGYTLRDKPGSIFTKPASDSIYHLSCTKPGLVSTKLGSCST